MKKFATFLLMFFSPLICQANNTEALEIERRLELADSLHSIGRTDSAAMVGEQTIRIAEKHGDAAFVVGAHAAQGVFLRSLGKIDEALKNYDAALEIVTSGKFRDNPSQQAIEQIGSLYINLAVLNLDMQNKGGAVKNAVLAGEWISKSSDSELKSVIYGAVGSVLTGCGELKKALDFQNLAYKNAMASGNQDAAFRAAAYTMLIADRLGDKSEAQKQREKCKALLPQIDAMMSRLVYYQAECSICLKNNDDQGAVKWFEEILNLDGIDNLPFVKFDCYNNLHIAQANLGNFKEAYNTLLKSNEVRDSIWAKEKAESLKELTVKYETKEAQLALAQSEAKRANTLMWLFGALGLLLIAIIIFIIYANRQRRRRMQKEIEFANLKADIGRQMTQQYIEGLENERQRMSRELHDGVCNDLLAIEMNLKNNQSLSEAVKQIDTCRESVRRISHELMPPEFTYASLDEVVRYFIMKQSEAQKGKICFNYESSESERDWTDIPDSTALETYRIIQEAVGNAVKHSGASQISIILNLDGKHLTAEIRDNGTYKSNDRKGIGLNSINRRAKSINGSVNISFDEEKGTTLTVSVPV